VITKPFRGWLKGLLAMVSEGYDVVPGELLEAAKVFKARAGDVEQMLRQWQRAADLPGGAFGNLAISPKMAAGYQEFYRQVTDDITKLAGSLSNGSENLVKAAGEYWLAEHLVSMYLQYLRQVRLDNFYLDRVDSGQEP
jgi:uncharacterized protein YukE